MIYTVATDDWDVSDDDKAKAPTPAPAAAPKKKKMTLKQKLAEKEKLAAEARANGSGEDELIDLTTEQDKRRQARERELEADLAAASDLMGATNLDTADALKAVLSAEPKTKSDFILLSQNLNAALLSRHISNPLYPIFVESLAKDICEPLTAVQTRKVSSTLTVLGNTKQQEERDKANGKKKTTVKKGAVVVGGAKSGGKIDTEVYDDVLDDEDFM
ncbi:hypothetical protein TREMEDRAFT_69827 [Tremella mesenterica DSM 1558]|uniref:uncharacterized protein n=1 Tax=Tremella mesenterica (strain ATCC 24925 / CBS 8224 / DSM 1558 / NBRC 9311 / NRRL Y-6157 / RJB 2259-6 / UBC 559-6) TaxID=578456 RepID=UPI0003F49419|nr:uncharacterized protein TREMEDRAFT_69827 [Tremella mesenterica DSM 1558]EIW67385.1 hypothetical protein TREMEDRAFT_69827 [Tremella mesenterica DSM 1558]